MNVRVTRIATLTMAYGLGLTAFVVFSQASCGGSSTDLSDPGATGNGASNGAGAGKGAGGGTGAHAGASGKGGSGISLGAGGGLMLGNAGTTGNMGCGLITCASAKATCGKIGDGCNSMIDCGTCPTGTTCGGGGVPSQCGNNNQTGCTPMSCAAQGFGCGMQGDTCGGTVDCGSCTAPEMCGGGGPNQCGTGSGTGPCTNLCLQQMSCGGGVTTTVSGTVYAPTPPKFGMPDPIYNAVVYIPNGTPAAFAQGASCDQCGSDVTGDPLVVTNSAYDGTFQLQNVPVGDNIPLVVQIGKWRRQITINVTACQDNPLTPDQTRLPRTHLEGDIPQIAVSTGSADGLECILRKIGIDDSEFTLPANQAGTGRVNLFVGNGATDSTGTAEDETNLEGNPLALAYFDMVILDCQGAASNEKNYQQNMIDFTTNGGRVFASHYSYDWLYNDAPFSTTADWSNPGGPPPNEDNGNTVTGIIDQSFPKGVAFAKWVDVVGASITPGSGKVTIGEARDDLPSTTVNSAVAQRWIYTDAPDPQTVQHYTFNTPVGPPANTQCGRVLFSDFHVTGSMGMMGGIHHNDGQKFPSECDEKPMSPQEKVLEFMLFDLSSCVQIGNMCQPGTCDSQHVSCGPAGDGCGNLLQCGMCVAPQTCGGGGVPGQCGMNGGSCTPTTCAALGYSCGPAGDGCGNLLQCGNCPTPQTCGGGGTPGQCGAMGIHLGGRCFSPIPARSRVAALLSYLGSLRQPLRDLAWFRRKPAPSWGRLCVGRVGRDWRLVRSAGLGLAVCC